MGKIILPILLIMSVISSTALEYDGESIVGIKPIEFSLWNGLPIGSEKVVAMNLPDLPFEYINPKLSVFLPAEKDRNGSFILVVPGGGYTYCSANGEGFKIAKWLVSQGIAAGVVQYRRNIYLKPLPGDKTKTEKVRVYDENVALEDAMRSMRIIRCNAREWGIDSCKIGSIGFSAGGHIVANMGVHPGKVDLDSSDQYDKYPTRPDFMILVYSLVSMDPPYSGEVWRNNLLGENFDHKKAEYYSCQNYVTPATPPCFIVCTNDDFTLKDGLVMYDALREKRVACELHIYEKGGHGYGMTHKQGRYVTKYWQLQLEGWLMQREIIPQIKYDNVKD